MRIPVHYRGQNFHQNARSSFLAEKYLIIFIKEQKTFGKRLVPKLRSYFSKAITLNSFKELISSKLLGVSN